MRDVPFLPDDEFLLFQDLLIEEAGLCFDRTNGQTLRFALTERIQKKGEGSWREYYDLLKSRPEGKSEIRELLDLVTIGETHFFRNEPIFEALINFVLPEIIRRKMGFSSPSIRMWSAGCSRGDEPYSLAIALVETLPSYRDWDISILGTDINKNALAKAEEAVYGDSALAQMPKNLRDKYFHQDGRAFVLDDKVKELVRLQYHNLAAEPFSSDRMQNLDIVFCRNVIIYFDGRTTKRVIDRFYDCLNGEGYLFLGHSETLWQITDKFETVNFPKAFIYKKASSPAEESTIQPFIGVPEIELEKFVSAKEKIPGKGTSSEEEPDFLYKEAADLFKGKQYPAALALFDEIIEHDQNYLGAYFAKATVLANQAKYQEAVDALKMIVATDALYIEAYYLLGVLLYKTGELEEAESQFRKVIYIDPDIAIAYFNLANIYLCQKKSGKAARELNNAIRLLEKRPRDEQARFCEDFTNDLLLRACKKSLADNR